MPTPTTKDPSTAADMIHGRYGELFARSAAGVGTGIEETGMLVVAAAVGG
jgi:hypothetical protein